MHHPKFACWIWLAAAGALFAQPDGRYRTLPDFPDGGATAGPRDIHIFLPPGYEAGQDRYRVIYFHDGEGVFGGLDRSQGVFVDADYTLDALLAENRIHPAILVAVTNTKRVPAGRSIDLVPRWTADSPGRIDEYYSFLASRLKPYVDAHFRTRPEAQYTGISGNSLGGLASFYLAYRHPETFGFAGCTSPSLWLMNSRLVDEVARDGKGRTATRFWLDAGERDSADIETVTPRMVKILAAKGWVEGGDLAFALGYGHLHGRTAQRERMRDMLYFLLRKEPPAPRGLVLRHLADPQENVLRLRTAGGRAYVWPEVQYEHGFRLNAVTAKLQIDDSAVAAVAKDEAGRVRNAGPGRTMLTAAFAGLKAQMPVEGYAPAYEKLPVANVGKPPTIDGNLEEWNALPFAIEPSKARFTTAYDGKFLYIAVAVNDSKLVIRPDKPSAEQDNVEVWLDARPDPMRSESKAWADGYQDTFLLARIAPSLSPAAPMPQPSSRAALPEGLLRASQRTARGYTAEFAIPIEYLDRMQGTAWREFRLNVHVTDFVSTGEPRLDLWWKPSWRTMESTAGSGTFQRP